MRYQTLEELTTDLRGEAGISQNVAHGVTQTPVMQALLRRIQEDLYLALEWPHLEANDTKDVPAGQRYTAYPDSFGFEGIRKVYVKDALPGSRWLPMLYGIRAEDLNTLDSDADDRSWPVQRWQNYTQPTGEDTNNNMFELWPVPDRDLTVRFVGTRKLFPFQEPGDKSTLDGPLIVLHAAAEILARQKSEDAALKLQKAKDRQRLLNLRQRRADNRPINMSGGRWSVNRFNNDPRLGLRPGIDYIPEQ